MSRVAVLIMAYAVLHAVASVLTSEFVLTDELLEGEWRDSFDTDRVSSLLDQRRTWMLLGYALIPAVLLVKITFTSLCLATGCALIDWECRFRDLLHVSAHAEAVFAFATVLHLVWCLLGQDFSSAGDYMTFYPLSALHLVELESSEMWMSYPLKTINAFEVMYVGALTIGLSAVFRKPRTHVLALVAASYGTGLALLVASVTFVSLYVF